MIIRIRTIQAAIYLQHNRLLLDVFQSLPSSHSYIILVFLLFIFKLLLAFTLNQITFNRKEKVWQPWIQEWHAGRFNNLNGEPRKSP